ncbi:hypothetical protein GA0115246_113792 [Streptomyces sp. SolWspMP-sol7th]|nr:hypothetical protein GA0115246_113792 [Streptomyces sp. SolWspMP-sol7th]
MHVQTHVEEQAVAGTKDFPVDRPSFQGQDAGASIAAREESKASASRSSVRRRAWVVFSALTPGPRTTPVRGWDTFRPSAPTPPRSGHTCRAAARSLKPPGRAARVKRAEAIAAAPRAARTVAARARTPPPRDVAYARGRPAACQRSRGVARVPLARVSVTPLVQLSRCPIRAHALRVPTALRASRHGEPSWPVPHLGGWPGRGSGGPRSRRAAGRRALEVQRECDPRRSEQPGGEPPRPGRSVRATSLGHHLVGRKAHHG